MKISHKRFLYFLFANALGVGGVLFVPLPNRDSTQLGATAQQPVGENQSEDKVATPKNDDVAAESYELDQVAPITLLQAIQTAEALAGGRAVEAELDWENGLFVYEVEIGNQEIVIDANTGEIIATEQEDEVADNPQPSVTMTLQEAVQIAESVADAQAHSAELEEEDDRLVYAIEIGNQEFHIDPDEGTILHIELEGHESTGFRPFNRIYRA